MTTHTTTLNDNEVAAYIPPRAKIHGAQRKALLACLLHGHLIGCKVCWLTETGNIVVSGRTIEVLVGAGLMALYRAHNQSRIRVRLTERGSWYARTLNTARAEAS